MEECCTEPQPRKCFTVRHSLCGMLFMGCFLVYAMRINLSVSIVEMVNQTASEIVASNDSCISDDTPINKTAPEPSEGEFDWDESQQAMITYAFFVGYLLSQIPGGYLAEKYSVTWVLGIGIGMTSLLTCLTSIAARFSFYAFIVLRVFEGVGEGVTFPCISVFVSRWVPVGEQSFLLNFIYAGCTVGVVVTMPVSAILCKSVLGWPASFYIFGLIGAIWTIVWMIVAADDPAKHRWISESEEHYILANRPASAGSKTKSTPWKKILLSPPVLCLGINRVASAMNFYMIITELPNYLNAIYGIDIINNGFINGGMNLGNTLTSVLAGALADRILTGGHVSRNIVRKVFTGCSTLLPSACLCALMFVGCRYPVVLGLLLTNCIMLGSSGGGDTVVALDLAPKYAGTVQGLTNMMGNFAGVLAPTLVGVLTEHDNTLKQWNLVFLYTAIFTTVGTSIFLIFGSTEEQKWALKDDDEEGLTIVNDEDNCRDC